MNFWQIAQDSFKKAIKRGNFKNFIQSPVTLIIGLNTAMFIIWRSKTISHQFLVRNFSFQKLNIKEHRYHTLITYAVSHFGFMSYILNMVMIGSFGKAIKLQFNKRIIWFLYLFGAAAGGIAMYIGMPKTPMIIPQVGADSSVISMITFYGLFNINQTVKLMFIPVRMWVLLGLLGAYCLYEPSRKSLGGAVAGLIAYQLFKVKII